MKEENYRAAAALGKHAQFPSQPRHSHSPPFSLLELRMTGASMQK
jgi:hypothetical protein